MKKKLSLLSDYVILLVVTIVLYRFLGTLPTALLLLFQIILAFAYWMLVTQFGSLMKAIPTINSSWLSIDGFNAKAFWRRRTAQVLFSYGVLLVCVVVERFICVD